jgi:hypothetical protein
MYLGEIPRGDAIAMSLRATWKSIFPERIVGSSTDRSSFLPSFPASGSADPTSYRRCDINALVRHYRSGIGNLIFMIDLILMDYPRSPATRLPRSRRQRSSVIRDLRRSRDRLDTHRFRVPADLCHCIIHR